MDYGIPSLSNHVVSINNPRLKCVGLTLYHTVAIVAHPIIIAAKFFPMAYDQFRKPSITNIGVWVGSLIISPFVQTMLAIKALFGILFPSCYYTFRSVPEDAKRFALMVQNEGTQQDLKALIDIFRKIDDNRKIGVCIQLQDIHDELLKKPALERKTFIHNMTSQLNVCEPGILSNITRYHQQLCIPQHVEPFLQFFDNKFKRDILSGMIFRVKTDEAWARNHQTNLLNKLILVVKGYGVTIQDDMAEKDGYAKGINVNVIEVMNLFYEGYTVENQISAFLTLVNAEGNETLLGRIQAELFPTGEGDFSRYLTKNKKGLFKFLNDDAARKILQNYNYLCKGR